MWSGLGNAAVVAQLIGLDAGGIISKIRQAARTARQNKNDCEQLAGRVEHLEELLQRLPQDPESLSGLNRLRYALVDAYNLITSCQGRGLVCQLWTASRQAERFRDIERRIDTCVSAFNIISYAGIARRLDGDNDRQSRLGSAGSGDEEHEFTLVEITAATNNFAVLLDGDSARTATATVYKGKLHNGHDVAVKRLNLGWRCAEDAFFTERTILSPLRHEHIVRLLGWCADDGQRIVVTPYMTNGSLYDHLHGHPGNSSSPVTASWKTRVQVLLGAARAIKHLHSHAMPLIIHGNVTSSNILLDANWAPRLSSFGASVWRAAGVESQTVEVVAGVNDGGYTDPEHRSTGRLKPASDVYNLGVVMLEVLTGKPPVVTVWEDRSETMMSMTLVSFALPSIQGGRLGDVLDRRPAFGVGATTRQVVQANPLQMLANTARHAVYSCTGIIAQLYQTSSPTSRRRSISYATMDIVRFNFL